MPIGKNKVVSIDYTLTSNEGQVLDTSKGGHPLTYIHGVGGLIPGLESALNDKNTGESLKVTVAPEQAYGQRDPKLVQPVKREMFAQVPNVQPGMQFQAQSPQGETRVVTVISVSPETITVDANHPLAGQTLNFDVTIVEVRDATPEELAHGHVHGPGGHQH